MKQLLFLLLFPCLALAQYQGNANQKITLGEQTTADGLVWRGRLADTANLLTNKLDTSVYIVLDTGTRAMWYYRASTTPKWTRLVDSLNNLQGQLSLTSKVTGVLPVANGGTGQTTLAAASIITGSGSSNKIPKFNGTNSLTNSKLNDDAATLTYTGIEIVAGDSNSDDAFFTMYASKNNYLQFKDAGGGAGAINYNHTNDYLAFKVNGSDRLTIKSDGKMGIGTGSPLAFLNVMGTVRINSASSPDANYYLQLENSASQKAKANAWDTYSDKRIKTDIQPIFNAIDKVNLLNPVYYQKHDSYVENDFLNIDYDNSVKSLGFIAQEVYNVIPEAVNTGTTNELWAMDYTKIIPILTKAIQEQQALIKALEQRILILENK